MCTISMKRLLANIITVFACAAACCVSSHADAQQTPNSPKPNIVFFLADDHGINECSPYGETQARTPFMDTLSQQGMRFNNAFIASPA